MKKLIPILLTLIFAFGIAASVHAEDDRFDLENYVYRTVVTNGKGALVFQNSPDGKFMNDYQYNDGETIYVNKYWRSDGYAIAYTNNTYGYVDAKYIDWDSRPGSKSSSSDDRYELSNYVYRTVVTNGRGALVFQKTPNGSFMNDYQYNDGDSIYVHKNWRQDGYAIAYSGGSYGYVDAGYINWSTGSSSAKASSDDRYDLSGYVYRRVVTNGRGALVFQKSPNGSFMNDYQYNDGDTIYVNKYWRSDGYAIAYSGGTYGYVDAGYIDWDSRPSSGSVSDDRYDLANYVTRTVVTGGRGALVFQKSPNGSFMNSYQFNDGDRIYVNKYWRSDGYAIAYSGGTYGYVDAGYIAW